MTARLWTWYYRVNQRVTPLRPKWLHLLLCTHCHGINAYVREQKRARRREAAA